MVQLALELEQRRMDCRSAQAWRLAELQPAGLRLEWPALQLAVLLPADRRMANPLLAASQLVEWLAQRPVVLLPAGRRTANRSQAESLPVLLELLLEAWRLAVLQRADRQMVNRLVELPELSQPAEQRPAGLHRMDPRWAVLQLVAWRPAELPLAAWLMVQCRKDHLTAAELLVLPALA